MAFFISLNTFTSIDSVNKITKMEGNILENENYVTSLGSLMNEYNKPSSTETEEQIFQDLEIKFRKQSNTSIEFTQNLQDFIDILVFFPALFNSKNIDKANYEEKMKTILSLMNKRKKALIAINSGNLILIKETVKLIEGVIAYQTFISHNKFSGDSTLLEVRGPMLRNSVTRTVYYNYLGLLYNKKAMSILREKLNLEHKDLLEIENLNAIQKRIQKLPDNDRQLAIMFLNDSRKAFQQAISHCKEDIMWLSFIKYNDARSCFFLGLITENNEHQNWADIMAEAVSTRTKLNILIKEVLKNKDEHSHLQNYFLYQEELARLVNLNILLAQKNSSNPIPTYKGISIYRIDLLQEIFYNDDQYPILKKYQDHIIAQMGAK
jgi:hypothetical protein